VSVLITGATGFIGAELCVHLLKLGHEVLAQGRSPEKLRRLGEAAPSGAPRLLLLPCELSELHELPRGVDAVVHAAAVREPEARVSPALAVETNVGGTVRLLDVANSAGVKRFVLLSSQSVYGSADPPWTEGRRPEPKGTYALSKYAAEQAVLSRLTGMVPVVLRVSRVYGAGLFMRWDELIGRFVRRARAGQTIEVYGDGLQRVDLVHVRDLASAIGFLLSHRSTLPESVYNVGGGGSVTVGEIASVVQETAESTGWERPPVSVRPDIIPTGPRHLELDITRIRRDLGWEPCVSLREAIREYFRLGSGSDLHS